MNLNISWVPPAIPPTCGYKIQYRKNEDTFYTNLSVASGTTTSVAISAPACYEGSIESDCCADSMSTSVPFGVNAYSEFDVEATNSDTGHFDLTVSSTYGNPYATLIEGVINYEVSAVPYTEVFSVTYLSNTTTQTFSVGLNIPGSALVTGISSLVYSPIFNHGGQLQQFDAINTPPYFQFLSSGTTVPAFNGSPLSLPSFILNQFNVTEVDTSGNTLAGNLLASWIQGESYSMGTSSPYDYLVLKVYDSSPALIGTISVPALPLGLRTTSIALTKAVDPLVVTTEFTVEVRWSDNTLIDTYYFYLP